PPVVARSGVNRVSCVTRMVVVQTERVLVVSKRVGRGVPTHVVEDVLRHVLVVQVGFVHASKALVVVTKHVGQSVRTEEPSNPSGSVVQTTHNVVDTTGGEVAQSVFHFRDARLTLDTLLRRRGGDNVLVLS